MLSRSIFTYTALALALVLSKPVVAMEAQELSKRDQSIVDFAKRQPKLVNSILKSNPHLRRHFEALGLVKPIQAVQKPVVVQPVQVAVPAVVQQSVVVQPAVQEVAPATPAITTPVIFEIPEKVAQAGNTEGSKTAVITSFEVNKDKAILQVAQKEEALTALLNATLNATQKAASLKISDEILNLPTFAKRTLYTAAAAAPIMALVAGMNAYNNGSLNAVINMIPRVDYSALAPQALEIAKNVASGASNVASKVTI